MEEISEGRLCLKMLDAKQNFSLKILDCKGRLLSKQFGHETTLLFMKSCWMHMQSKTFVQKFWMQTLKEDLCSNMFDAKQDSNLFKNFGCKGRLLYETYWVQSKSFLINFGGNS